MGALSKLQAYSFAILLAKPFESWKAYDLGLIDEKGEIVKKPSTPEEKNALDTFENLIRKIKRILLKYIPSPKLLTFLISAYLLKSESTRTSTEDRCFAELNEILSDKESDLLYNILTTYSKF